MCQMYQSRRLRVAGEGLVRVGSEEEVGKKNKTREGLSRQLVNSSEERISSLYVRKKSCWSLLCVLDRLT